MDGWFLCVYLEMTKAFASFHLFVKYLLTHYAELSKTGMLSKSLFNLSLKNCLGDKPTCLGRLLKLTLWFWKPGYIQTARLFGEISVQSDRHMLVGGISPNLCLVWGPMDLLRMEVMVIPRLYNENLPGERWDRFYVGMTRGETLELNMEFLDCCWIT